MEAKESHCLMSEEIRPPVSGKDSHGLLPVVEKNEVILKDEIGRGSFGKSTRDCGLELTLQ